MNDLKNAIINFSAFVLAVLVIFTFLTYHDKSEDSFIVVFMGLTGFSIFIISTCVFVLLRLEEKNSATSKTTNKATKENCIDQVAKIQLNVDVETINKEDK